jgi:hypothetical protein
MMHSEKLVICKIWHAWCARQKCKKKYWHAGARAKFWHGKMRVRCAKWHRGVWRCARAKIWCAGAHALNFGTAEKNVGVRCGVAQKCWCAGVHAKFGIARKMQCGVACMH